MSFASQNLEERTTALRYLEERFGIPPGVFQNHQLVLRGEYLCAFREEGAELVESLSVVQAGLKLVKLTGSGGCKPSTRGMQVFGRYATRNVVDLSDSDLRGLVEGRSLPGHTGKGFVLLRHRGLIAGVGLVRDEQLVSQLPRAVTMHLKLPALPPAGP